jgi:hypothetical protein
MTIDYTLKHGSHKSPQDGLCAMEWVSYLAGEKHSDSPVCVDPVLQSFGIALNDNWSDEQRQKLRPYLARCIGTANDGRSMERSWLAMDWLIRTYTPAFLDLRPELKGHAEKLRALSPVLASEALDEAMILLNEAKHDAAAAGDAAWDAAGDAAWDAAGDAAWAAAGDAAWAAARAAAWAAAGAAAWAAAGDAARAAAGDAARAAAGDAAGDALKPTVDALQDSALDLFGRMLPTETVELPPRARAEYDQLMAEVSS